MVYATVARVVLPMANVRSWVVGVDQNGQVYEREGIDRLEAAERAAQAARYGKLSPRLYDILQTKGPEDRVRVSIAIVGVRDTQDVWAEIRARHPEAHLDTAGRPTKDTPPNLYDKVIYPEFLNEMKKSATAASKPLADYLRSLGYDISVAPLTGGINGLFPKRIILALQARNDVGEISPILAGGENLSIATPSSAAPTNWERSRGVTGNSIKIGVLEDVGTVDFQNPYLRGQTVGEVNVGPHATQVAGAAISNHPRYRGTAFNASLLSAKKGSDYQQNTESMILAGARVINHSWFVVGAGFTAEDRYYDYLTRNFRITNVVAAGNQGSERTVDSPGKGYNVITIGGYNDRDDVAWKGDAMYEDALGASSWRNPAEQNEKPELAAPAQGIMSTVSQGFNDTDGDWIRDYPGAGGTSLAAPHVAGGAAMLFEQRSSLSEAPEAVKAILMASAIHNVEGNPTLVNDPPTGTSDVRDGAGAVNLAEAYRIVASNWWETAWVNLTSTSHFDPNGWYLFPKQITGVKNTERVRAAIAWNSAAPSPYSSELKTDLNLWLVRLDSAGNEIEIVSTSLSATNSVESLDYFRSTAPTTTDYRLKIQKASSTESSNVLGIAWWVGPRYYAATSLGQDADSLSDPVFKTVLVDSAAEPRQPSKDNQAAIIPGGIQAYKVTLTYPAWASSTHRPIAVQGVTGNGDPSSPFYADPTTTINNPDGITEFYYDSGTAGPQPLVKLARIALKLDGSAREAHDLYQYFNYLKANTNGETVGVQTAIYQQFQRGDVTDDMDSDPSNDISIVDALFIGQYLAELRSLDTLNAVNAASPQHDPPYDVITIVDAMFILQYLATLRDEYFNLI